MAKRLGGTCGIPAYDDRTYVGVLAMDYPDGRVLPRRIVWPDGRHWDVASSEQVGRWGRDDWGNVVKCFEVTLGVRRIRKRIWWESGRWFVKGASPLGKRDGSVDVSGAGNEIRDWMTRDDQRP